MDIHICFLEDGCCRSRYFGSQFLGKGRAEDLLQHIKVSLFLDTYWLVAVLGSSGIQNSAVTSLPTFLSSVAIFYIK